MVKFFSCPFENNFELLDYTLGLKTAVRSKFSFKIFKGEMKIMKMVFEAYVYSLHILGEKFAWERHLVERECELLVDS